MNKLNILLLVNKNDLDKTILGKTMIEHLIKQLEKHNLKIFSKYVEVREKIDSKFLLETPSLQEALGKFNKGNEEEFVLITKLATSNIDYEKLITYHKGHKKKCTIVLRNLVKNRTIPVYKLDDHKTIIGINKKRYASCGVYVFSKNVNFKGMETLGSIIESFIKEKELKGFVHTGYFQTERNKIRNVGYIVKRRRSVEDVTKDKKKTIKLDTKIQKQNIQDEKPKIEKNRG